MKRILPFLLIANLSVALTPDEHATLHALPILSSKCAACHGEDPEDIDAELNLLSREGYLKGGETIDDLLVPGDASKSFLMTVIKWEDDEYEMPPKENDRLNLEQIAHIETWINNGAPWPSDEVQKQVRLAERTKKVTDEGMIVDHSGGLNDDWTYRRYQPEDIWAFLPLEKPEAPAEGTIDHFVGEQLTEAKQKPAPQADFRTLIRRASYDLTGLPPTPTEVHHFNTAAAKDFDAAWSELITRLLDSPHYGERWGQHWLDVARYSDTGGLSNDYERSNMWRYRDYVIRSFNDDKPYNKFVMEQIAGDELADESLRTRVADDANYEKLRKNGSYSEKESEQVVASSFLRMGPWDPAMVKVPEARQQYLDDVVNAVGQTFLSTTMRCFKCHDHKFDPLPTKDYYRMYSVFAGTQLAERHASFTSKESQERFDTEKAQVERLYKFANDEATRLQTKVEDTAKKWYTENDREYKALKARNNDPEEEKPPRHAGLDETEKGQLKVREQDAWIWKRRLERFEPMAQSVYNGSEPGFLNARKLRINEKDKTPKKPKSFILTGGALEAQGEKVTPGVLSALAIPTEDASAEDAYQISEDVNGRRLALAKWIAHPKNPLTARSIVNRVWQYHFGKPLAGNPNNFGVKGAKPTHPELLDWLASDFVENGWKMKRLHKIIMQSGTYQQSGIHPDRYNLAERDPTNSLLAYFPNRRLTAEELRDGMLHITGELNPNGGGLPIRPEMNMEVALQPRMIQFSIAPTYLPSRTPEERNRRSIYAYRVRGLADPFLETFNQPNPNDSCEARDAASVSPQAFTLMNSDLVTARSIAFALRLEKEAGTLPKRIQRAFHLTFSRNATDKELEQMVAYVTEMKDYHADQTPEKRQYPTEITRSLVEEFSGQPFEYQEILPIFEDYLPDTQAADATPETRALADFCLLLFNSHEFVYSY
ncbi:MAG: PSD1 and planctomycete cytochrome C domain-containing protein [Akkermansiaceae bacterium]|jgi:mono/diheme cytochrome c family protein|nr:PSD1 and planctomycete cytochrome C domain-containing protein [Akkermansiaceae bacterium]